MVRITVELIRKRAEHNNGEIFPLEELSLHQLGIEKLEHVDKLCPNLKILLLQGNLISKIENVKRLKKLEYLNLALNNVTRIENISDCESLEKLDLTLNFIEELSSILALVPNYNLKELYLIGNPCAEYEGYRDYVIACLPQLAILDGKMIARSERIRAIQLKEIVSMKIKAIETERATAGKNHAVEKEKTKSESDADPVNFWAQKVGNTPEDRIKLFEELQKLRLDNDEGKRTEMRHRAERKLCRSDGKILNINEPKIKFKFTDDDRSPDLLLDVAVYRFLDTSLIDVDLQPTYIRITIKGKILQLELPTEVKTDQSSVQRSETTGHLLIRMPKMNN